MVVIPGYIKRMPRPRKGNGEAKLAAALEQLGLEFTYEKTLYKIGGVGFRPDFNLAATRRWPELNVELTWADRDHKSYHLKGGNACLNRKVWKIHRTREIYGVHTVLVTYRDWKRIMRNPRYLVRMIEQELNRNYSMAAAV
jgi:hypothetical protein